MHDRESIEQTNWLERPSVRIRIEVVYVDEDGIRTYGTKESTGRVIPDANKVWIDWSMGDVRTAFWVSWGLLLEVLNDRFASPILVNHCRPVELHH